MTTPGFILTSCLLCLSLFLHAQQEIGYHFDHTHQPINGYFDPMHYQPAAAISFHVSYGEYRLGRVVKQNGSVLEGLILLKNKAIKYKANEDSKEKITIPYDEFKHLTFGRDSMVIARVGKKQRLIHILANTKKLVFGRAYKFDPDRRNSFNYGPKSNYYVFDREIGNWLQFPEWSRDLKVWAKRYLTEHPILLEATEATFFTSENRGEFIKAIKYASAKKYGDRIFFDEQWNEILEPSENGGYAIVSKIEFKDDKMRWNLKFHLNNGQLYAAGDFSALHKRNRVGQHYLYYPDGKVRKEMSFQRNELRKYTEFFPNGSRHTRWMPKTEYSSKYDTHFCESLWNQEEEIMSTQTGNATEKLPGLAGQGQVTRTFKDGALVQSQCENNSSVIRHRTQNRTELHFQNRWQKFMKNQDLNPVIRDNASGMLLVSLQVSTDGNLKSYNLLTTLHPQFDQLVKDFLKKYQSEEISKKINLIGDEQFDCEIVVPFVFTANIFESIPRYDTFFWMMDQQMLMMHQQMMMNQDMMRLNQQMMRSPTGF